MFNYTGCPVCKNQSFKNFLSCEDYTVSHKVFDIVSCGNCGFKFTNPIPDFKDLGSYYKSENYISHSNTKSGLISRLYHLVRSYTLKKKLSLIKEHVSRGTILDYGAGTGMFLDVCKNDGWKVYGLEPDPGAGAFAKGVSGLVLSSDKGELKSVMQDDKMNIITLWHVLEHVTDLEDTLKFFKESLHEDGLLVVAVPNHKSYDAEYYGKHWAAYDVPRHLYHFELSTMTVLMERFGFSLYKTLPMKFDSFYVSMLSEKYKTGSVRYLSAFMKGLKSNIKARKGRGYSSTIYIFKHK